MAEVESAKPLRRISSRRAKPKVEVPVSRARWLGTRIFETRAFEVVVEPAPVPVSPSALPASPHVSLPSLSPARNPPPRKPPPRRAVVWSAAKHFRLEGPARAPWEHAARGRGWRCVESWRKWCGSRRSGRRRGGETGTPGAGGTYDPTAQGCELTCRPSRCPPTDYKMAKSKNHTAHNQTRKAHRNGIKKPKSNRYPSLKGVRRTRLPHGPGPLSDSTVLLRLTPSS